MASITIRNLLLYTTNENWQVVNLKEARDYSNDKKFIYVFKKLEWEHLSIDLLPHPDMFAAFSEGAFKDDDGAKAGITIQRTELNSPLGLELQLHITEAVCPALSEPGLRALLRFFTGFYVCLNRGDVNPNAQERSAEAAGRTLVSIMVDHIFFCIKDTDFQLELMMQSLLFSRASLSDGEIAKCLTRVMIGGVILRDTSSRPPCALVQPSTQDATEEPLKIPDFGKDFCPPIYPLGDQQWKLSDRVPLISLHCLQFIPSPTPPLFSTQTVIDCQPLMIHLQEDSCLRISSLLADGIVVNHGDILPDYTINSLELKVKGLDITVPMENQNESSFTGARLHIENLFFHDSPSLRLKLLNLDKDPACFCLWKGQPIDASQKKWTSGASLINMSLETCNNSKGVNGSRSHSSELWKSVEIKGVCVQVAMVTADGSPLIEIPPPGGVVRVGVACEQYMSNTSVEQLFFVLDLYTYFGMVSEKMALVGKNKQKMVKRELSNGNLIEKVPGDTAVSLVVKDLKLTFLESSSIDIQGMPLVQFVGEDLFMEVTHRTLGGAMAISSTLKWERVQVDCAETEISSVHTNDVVVNATEDFVPVQNGYPKLRAVFWVQNESESVEDENHSGNLHLGAPDDVDVSLELKDWLFALEGADMAEKWWLYSSEDSYREERCWHTTFDSIKAKANSSKKSLVNGKKNFPGSKKYPVESMTVGIEGLKTLKPQQQKGTVPQNGHKQRVESHGGVDFEADIVLNEDDDDDGMVKWVLESLKFSVKHPVEAVVTKDELQHVAQLCKSEVDSMGRIMAGALRVLKLEGSLGQSAMNQLSNLGSEGFDKIFSPENPRRDSTASSVGMSPFSLVASDNHSSSFNSTLNSLEAALLESQTDCAALVNELSSLESPEPHIHSVEQLAQKLESMQKLLLKLQTRV
ncbi:chorein [Tanacetum coccineum]